MKQPKCTTNSVLGASRLKADIRPSRLRGIEATRHRRIDAGDEELTEIKNILRDESWLIGDWEVESAAGDSSGVEVQLVVPARQGWIPLQSGNHSVHKARRKIQMWAGSAMTTLGIKHL